MLCSQIGCRRMLKACHHNEDEGLEVQRHLTDLSSSL